MIVVNNSWDIALEEVFTQQGLLNDCTKRLVDTRKRRDVATRNCQAELLSTLLPEVKALELLESHLKDQVRIKCSKLDGKKKASLQAITSEEYLRVRYNAALLRRNIIRDIVDYRFMTKGITLQSGDEQSCEHTCSLGCHMWAYTHHFRSQED